MKILFLGKCKKDEGSVFAFAIFILLVLLVILSIILQQTFYEYASYEKIYHSLEV